MSETDFKGLAGAETAPEVAIRQEEPATTDEVSGLSAQEEAELETLNEQQARTGIMSPEELQRQSELRAKAGLVEAPAEVAIDNPQDCSGCGRTFERHCIVLGQCQECNSKNPPIAPGDKNAGLILAMQAHTKAIAELAHGAA